MSPQARSRAGVVLIVAVGLAAIIATMALALILNMRSDTRESAAVLAHAQSRIMLSAALGYVQESARLGWDGLGGVGGVGGVGDNSTGETFGWTDYRDGALGPRGARPPAGGGSVNSNGGNIDPDPANTVPTWWAALYGSAFTTGSTGANLTYQPYFSSADEANSGRYPAPTLRRWPLPGSAVRCDMPVWSTPPYAIKPIYAANPFRPPVAYGDPAWTTTWKAMQGMNQNWLRDTFDANQGALGMLDPQPVSDTWNGFVAGNPELRPATQGQAWFRIYRELLSDHDNVRTNDVDYGILSGDVSAITARSYDTVALYDPIDPTTYNPASPSMARPLRNYSVFIVTCGAGGSRGSRFWGLPGNDPRRAIEPVTASESGLFPSEAVFNLARQGEVVRWFRIEHSTGVLPGTGEVSKRIQYMGNDQNGASVDWSYPWFNWSGAGNVRDRPAASGSGDDPFGFGGGLVGPGSAGLLYGADQAGYQGLPNIPLSRGGSIKWIQRLAQEPIKW